MPDGRLVIVGMNNPLTDRSDAALLPYPSGCAGWRLWKMVNDVCGVTRAEYCRLTERMNLVDGRAWDPVAAASGAAERWKALQGRRALVLGVGPRAALRLCRVGPALWEKARGVEWCGVPHPSGLCREYNDPLVRLTVGLIIEEELERARSADVSSVS